MTSDMIMGLVQEMLWLTLRLGAPPLLAGLVKKDLDRYLARLAAGEFPLHS